MAAILIDNMGTIDLGRQGENLARTIEFDVSNLLESWPEATISLLVKRKGDANPYFSETTVVDGVLRWPITSTETAAVGEGKIEIQAICGEVLAKSVTAAFRVTSSLSGAPSAALPEVYPSWVDKLLSAAGKLTGSVFADPNLAHHQLVSNSEGKAVWEEKLAYKYVTTSDISNLPETKLLGEDDDEDGLNDMFFIPTAWTPDLVAGTIYRVNYNGVQYECEAVAYTEEGAPEGCVILGNASLTGLAGGNEEAPFAFLCVPNAIVESLDIPFWGMGSVSDGAPEVTLSIACTAEIAMIKTIDDDLLPDELKRTPITLTISSGGAVTSNVSFAEAWKMSPGQLHSAIAIKETGVFKGECYASVDTVSKCTGALGGYMADFISIRIRKPWIDSSDTGDQDTVRVINWNATSISVTDTFRTLPHYGSSDSQEGYLKYTGNNNWQKVSIDDLKADLGLTDQPTT